MVVRSTGFLLLPSLSFLASAGKLRRAAASHLLVGVPALVNGLLGECAQAFGLGGIGIRRARGTGVPAPV